MSITKQLQPLFVTLLLGAFASGAFAVDGQLDATFNGNGVALTSFGVQSSVSSDVLQQTDGKLVVVGSIGNDFLVMRYNIDGSLDLTFGVNGLVMTDLGNTGERAYAVRQQVDGKLLVAGSTGKLFRYNLNGSVDDGYGVSGVASVACGVVVNIALQTDGATILVCGYGLGSGRLVRFTTDGILDSSFGSSGIVDVANSPFQAVAIQSDGKIIVGGCKLVLPNCTDFKTMRFSSNGSIDLSFGTNGAVVTDAGQSRDNVQDIVVQSDGKIIVSGSSNAGSNIISIVRYNANGSIDNSFGTLGKVTGFIGHLDGISRMAITVRGEILITGSFINGGEPEAALVRYTNSGVIDANFSSDGMVELKININDIGRSLVLQANGKIVMVGDSYTPAVLANYPNIFIARFIGGDTDNDFDTDGDSDVMWYDSSTGNVNVWGMQAGLENSWNFIAYWPDTTNVPSLTADIDGDGDSDILWYNATSGNVNAWVMQAGAKTNWTFLGYWPDANVQPVATGDFDGDGDDDILWYNSNTGDVNIWVMQAGVKVNWVYVGYWPATNNKPVLVGDFNGDGTDDILWWNNVSGDVDIWVMQNNAKTNWLYVGTWPDTNNRPVGAGDFNNDGTDDILWWNSTSGNVNSWTMLAGARSNWTWIGAWPDANVHIEEVGDFNGDGTADILWRDITSGSVTSWPMLSGVKQTGQYIGTFPGTSNSIKAGL